MPHDEQYDWPSFETVLRDVATSDAVAENYGLEIVESIEVPQPPSPQLEATAPTAEAEQAAEAASGYDIDLLPADLLPEPLAPVDFDTSSVRALLEPIGTTPAEPFELDALAPLTPEADETEIAEPAAIAEPTPPEPSVFDELDDVTFAPEPFEPESVFDLAFDADAHAPAAEAPDEPPVLQEVGGIEIPTETSSTEVFDDLGIEGEISLDDLPVFADVDEDTSEATFDDSEIGDLPSGAVFELDADVIDETFDSVATANAIEGELNELNELSALATPFDSVLDPEVEPVDTETPEAEDPFALNNVIPLRPEQADTEALDPLGNSEWLNPVDTSPPDGPPATRVSHTGWVGLDATTEEQETPESDPDPWAYMRPSEEPKSEGFWAKIFGGDERKRARARRMAKKNEEDTTTAEPQADADASFDRACPNCGADCVVDLDDPIGRRVHVSCPECDHMWNTPYLEAG